MRDEAFLVTLIFIVSTAVPSLALSAEVAMRKAADLTVKGMSAKGTETTDIFSLKGLSQALDRLSQDCRR